ncbi:MAG: nucleotidyltransferase family protein [Armatimonadetes bacterium]|nr:nucleotidyltransferase family protein [Armatimonadota bacterium]
MVDAIVLAGGRIPESEADFRAAGGADSKSLVQVNGRIMVSWVVAALKAADGVNRVAVVGPPELQGHPDLAEADVVVPEREGRSENLFAGVEALPGAQRILMMASDQPLAEPAMVDDLLAHLPAEVDLGWVAVRAADALAKYGDRPPPPPDERGVQMPNWVTLRLRDGRFTGTACLVFSVATLEGMRPFLKGIFDNREMGNVIRVVRPVLGLGLLLRLGLALKFPTLGCLVSVGGLERRVSQGFGITCRVYVSPYPELAFDLDHASDLPLVERELRWRTEGV